MSNLQERLSNLTPEQRELLASRLRERLAQERRNPEQGIPKAPAGQPVPLSAAQERLWFLQLLEPDVPVHNLPRIVQLRGALNVAALRKALNALIERHHPLRTVYRLEDGRPVQLVQEQWADGFMYVDLRDLPEQQRQQAVDREIAKATAQPFDLSADLMLRSWLFQLDDNLHILFLLTHHIASDSWSRGVFYSDLGHFYSAFDGRQPPKLPLLSVSYADYAFWQRAQLKSPAMEKHIRYWLQVLAGDPPLLELPADRARPAAPTFKGGRVHYALPGELISALERLAEEERVTLYMALLSVFYLLLYRYTGQRDLWVGAPAAGRSRAELEQLVGVFINTLVLRCQVDASFSYRQLLQQVKAITLDAYEHQAVPFEHLLERLKPNRDPSHTPLVQVMFNYHNVPAPEWQMGSLEVEVRQKQISHVPMDLSVIVTPAAGGLRLTAEYATDLFDRHTMVRLLDHYTGLLEAVVADPETALSHLPLLDTDEARQILHEWQGPTRQWPDVALLELWQRQLVATPHAVAFFDDETRLTYADLERQSDAVAASLLREAVGSGDVVGLCLPRSPEAMVAIMAIFKVGAILLPLDPNYPQARIHFMIADAGAKRVLTNDSVLNKLPLNQAISLNVSRIRVDDPVPPSPGPDRRKAEDPAYIMYTSGSTGQPKGALVPYRQVLNRLHWMWDAYPFAADEVGCQKTALSFVDSLWETFGPLLKGIPTVIVPDRIVADPPRLVDFLARHGATRLWLVPSLLQAILDNVPDLQQRLPQLRMWVTSGEPISPSLWDRFRRDMPRATLYNLYGTSEVWDVTWYAPPVTAGSLQRVPIGRPLSNVDVFILDEFLNPVPVGVAGELCVGGAALALGYVGRPELTAARFPPSPFRTANSPAGARLYRTGDLARWLPDGNIEFLGRADSQVKLRGHRIELEEVVTHLDRHPAVRQTVAAVQAPGSPDARLVVYCLPEPGQTPSATELSRFLQDHLPAFMVPSAFLLVDAVPLTPSGKIDRRALAENPSVSAALSDLYAPPRTPTEQALAAIWTGLLDVARVGIHDNFFDAGGHSLLGIRLFARIEEQFGRRLPLSLLFSAPTIARLAVHLQRPSTTPLPATLVPIQEGGSGAPFFCVHGFGGGVLGYADLALLLVPQRPFYGLQAAGVDGTETPDATIEAMASRYIAAMRAVQPHGPYRIGGYCYGGVVAFEMARQLEQAGEETALVAIMEGYAPRRYRRRASALSPRRWLTTWRNLPYWISDYWNAGARGVHRRIRRNAGLWRKRLRRRLGADVVLTPEDVSADDISMLPRNVHARMSQHLRSLHDYDPRPIRGKVTLFAARTRTVKQAIFGSLDQAHGWGALAKGGVDVRLVDGGHRNIHLHPYVPSLAAALAEALEEVE